MTRSSSYQWSSVVNENWLISYDARYAIEKRIPASILLESPWFETHGIHDVSDAVAIMHRYFQDDTREE